MYYICRMVPRKVSSYMLLTGIPIDAEEALRSGLISKLSEDDAGLEEELELVCDAIAAKPKAVIELGKSFYRQQLEMGELKYMIYFIIFFPPWLNVLIWSQGWPMLWRPAAA